MLTKCFAPLGDHSFDKALVQCRLCLLFSAMLRHSYVPSSFRYGIVKPILKNKHGDNTSIYMYRGIMLTPVNNNNQLTAVCPGQPG